MDTMSTLPASFGDFIIASTAEKSKGHFPPALPWFLAKSCTISCNQEKDDGIA
jgi:hypothetical protein